MVIMAAKTQLQHKTYAAREDTPVEVAVKAEWREANGLLQRLAADSDVLMHTPERVPRPLT